MIINAVTPSPPTTATVIGSPEPQFRVDIEYHPEDGHTPAQIGNEVARVMRKVNQIIEGGVD